MTQILDLDALQAKKEAATQGDGQHMYANPRDDNNWKANEDWHRACSPAVIGALIDRLRKAEAQVEAMRSMLRETEAIAKARGDAYLFDAIDNDGVLYQSGYLAGLIATPGSTPTDSADSEGAKG